MKMMINRLDGKPGLAAPIGYSGPFQQGACSEDGESGHSFRVGCAEFPLAVDWQLGLVFCDEYADYRARMVRL